MTYPPAEPDLSSVCPYLGLADDADSHATYATEAHRCYRMPNPTRIAAGHQEAYCLGANHVTCPVYTGEGISKVAAPAAAAAAVRPAPAAPEGFAPVAAPAPGQGRPQQPRAAASSGPRPRRAGGGDGQLRARPRPGGISMPAATIGLFALAIVLIAIAFLINEAVDGNGSAQTSEADAFATQNALKTAQAGNQTPAVTQSPQGNQTPGNGQTPQTTQTPGATQTTTSGAGGGTYTVKPGDTCFAIAQANNTTVEKLMAANNITDPACPLNVGDTLKLR